jgi:hypothetical protein
LDFRPQSLSDEMWGAVCASLKAHPTLEVLDLLGLRFTTGAMTPAVLKLRIQGLFNMMKVNTSIHTIHLDYHFNGNDVYRESIVPYLETNRFRSHVRAIKKNSPLCVPCQGAGTSASCSSNRRQSLLDAAIGECRSCLSADNCCRRYCCCSHCCDCRRCRSCFYCFCRSQAQGVSVNSDRLTGIVLVTGR